MGKRPFFTVIIPTLNEQSYLPKLLTSLVRQTYREFEVIIVDGKSIDRTVESAQKFSAKLPSFQILTGERRNPSYQRNLGAKRGKGAYFVFLDADVEIPPEFLEGVHYALITRKYPFVTTWVDAQSKRSSDQLLVAAYNLMTMEVLKAIGKQFAPGFNMIIRRDVFEKVGGFNERIRLTDDHNLSIRIGKGGYPLTILKEPKLTMSLRRFHSAGTLRTVTTLMQACFLVLLNEKPPKDYPMGGHVHQMHKRSSNRRELTRMLHKLQQLETRFSNLLKE